MKKTILLMTVLGIIAACGGGDKKDNKTEAPTTSAKDITTEPDYQKGVAIVAKSDCPTCHHINDKLIGPAWKDVANKYAGQDTAVSYLAKKIIEGGSGVWGTVPMAPHATMSQEDAETLARYVLLLKDN